MSDLICLDPSVYGKKIYCRPGGDERILKEVLGGIYRRKSIGFDVEQDEMWLDLGANIGAFAVYCELRGARVHSYEPDRECFAILKKNLSKRSKAFNFAVTASPADRLVLFSSPVEDNHSRGTIIPVRGYTHTTVLNLNARELKASRVHGVKMDIEGSEGAILDQWLLPYCAKLCLEYHTSRDPFIKNLARRLKEIKRRFKVVAYPPEFDRAIASGAEIFKSHFDRMIFAKDPR